MAKIYNVTVDDGDNISPVDYASGMVWDEVEYTESPMPVYHRYVDTVNGVEVWYDFGADYYFFVAKE